MFKFIITTVRPNTAVPFYINTAEGQVYDEQMQTARAAKMTGGGQPNALLSMARAVSFDGLTLVSDYSFVSPLGRDELFAEFDALATASGRPIFLTVRDAYNKVHGQVTTVVVE